MKKILGLIGLALILFIASCTKEDTSSPNYDARDKLVGTWLCTEQSDFGNHPFTVIIKKSTSDKINIIISNFYQLGNDRNAIVSVNGTNLNIASQIVDGNIISGSGSTVSSGSAFTLNYNADNGQGKTDHVVDSFTK